MYTVMATGLVYAILFSVLTQQVFGNGGRLMDPPSRSSAWRVGFPTPHNYEDNDVSCGGFLTLVSNGGKCGVCGDAWNGKRENEAGGMYATGTIVRKYNIGQKINIIVDVTGDHLGWMEFRICPNNDVTKPVTHDCLNKHVLQKADGTGARTHVNSRTLRNMSMNYMLPDGMSCSQCVLQWKYHTDDTWGVDKETGRACIGCGYQEEFYGCADVAIGGTNMVTQKSVTPQRPRVQTTKSPIQTTKSVLGGKTPCKGLHNWANDPAMDRWCTDNCAIGNCPVYGCDCGQSVTEKTTTTSTTTTTTTPVPTTTARPTTTSTTTTTTTTPQPTTTSTSTTTSTATSTKTQKPTTTSSTTTSTTTLRPTTSATNTAKTQPAVQLVRQCKAVNLWAGNEYLDRWCADSCAHGQCPPEACKCTMVPNFVTKSTVSLPKTSTTVDPSRKVCRALSVWKGIQVFDMWCTDECNKGNCPAETCECTDPNGFPTTTTTTSTTKQSTTTTTTQKPTMMPTTKTTTVSTTETPTTTTTTTKPDMTPFGKCVSNGIVGGDYWDRWCQTNCDKRICDNGYCFCNV